MTRAQRQLLTFRQLFMRDLLVMMGRGEISQHSFQVCAKTTSTVVVLTRPA